jgi:hypothetical protein
LKKFPASEECAQVRASQKKLPGSGVRNSYATRLTKLRRLPNRRVRISNRHVQDYQHGLSPALKFFDLEVTKILKKQQKEAEGEKREAFEPWRKCLVG